MADPAAFRRYFMLSLYTAGEPPYDPAELVSAVRRRAGVLLDVGRTEHAPRGPAELLWREGGRTFDGTLHGVHLYCRGPEWSLGLAAFSLDVLTQATEHGGVARTALLTVFSNDDDNPRRNTVTVSAAMVRRKLACQRCR